MRLQRQDKIRVVSTVTRLIAFLEREPLRHHLWIVGEEDVRICGSAADATFLRPLRPDG